mmetsp:Transcript_9153/g.12774  ORF Transcript_9153/g.12774 Transcript_9153/m.12774 type:complete len:170 (-) Transcript_9153:768-1277(-)
MSGCDTSEAGFERNHKCKVRFAPPIKQAEMPQGIHASRRSVWSAQSPPAPTNRNTEAYSGVKMAVAMIPRVPTAPIVLPILSIFTFWLSSAWYAGTPVTASARKAKPRKKKIWEIGEKHRMQRPMRAQSRVVFNVRLLPNRLIMQGAAQVARKAKNPIAKAIYTASICV